MPGGGGKPNSTLPRLARGPVSHPPWSRDQSCALDSLATRVQHGKLSACYQSARLELSSIRDNFLFRQDRLNSLWEAANIAAVIIELHSPKCRAPKPTQTAVQKRQIP